MIEHDMNTKVNKWNMNSKNMNEMQYRIDIYEMIYMYCKERNMRIVI